MTNDFLRKVQISPKTEQNRYAELHFHRNPFPTKPSVTPGSPDDRENGSIYVPQLRNKEGSDFQKLLIPTNENPQTRPIAFLMDFATRRGRGIGKTAFLHYQKKRIMEDLGKQMSGGRDIIFSVYLLPDPDGKTRKFWQFNKLLMKALSEQEIIATAMWRLRAFSGIISQDILQEVGDDPRKTLGCDDWLRNKGVNIGRDFMTDKGLNDEIERNLRKLGISPNLAGTLAQLGHDANRFGTFIDSLSDRSWSSDNGNMLFNDLVKVLREAGFTRGIILVDEVEKVIAPQNSAERRAFTDSIRYFFIDGFCENARISFCNLLLTIHPYVQELLNPHWNATGLDRFAALSGELASEYTIYFEPLNQAFAIPLAKAYMDASRLNLEYKDSLEPFESEAIVEALVLSGRVPGVFLTLLNHTVEKAVTEGKQTITASFIRDVAKIREPQEPGQDDRAKHLETPQVNLQRDE